MVVQSWMLEDVHELQGPRNGTTPMLKRAGSPQLLQACTQYRTREHHREATVHTIAPDLRHCVDVDTKP